MNYTNVGKENSPNIDLHYENHGTASNESGTSQPNARG